MKPSHFLQIDLLKGIAIIGVLIQHTVGSRVLEGSTQAVGTVATATASTNLTLALLETFFDCFHRQAVPLFIVIMGVTSGLSFMRRGYILFKEWPPKEYFARRLERFYPPYLIVVFASLLIGLFETYITQINQLNLNIFVLIGLLPIPGAQGAYFVPLIFQLVLLFPLLFYFYRKNPKLLLVACFVVSFAFQFFYYFMHLNYTIYDICILRFLPAIALGLWIVDDSELLSKRNRFIVFGAFISVIYIFFAELAGRSWIVTPANPATLSPLQVLIGLLTPIAFFYTALVVIVGIRYLPKSTKSKFVSSIAYFGRASYHIFLIQLLYFSLFITLGIITLLNPTSNTLVSFVILLGNSLLCIGCGILFMHGTDALKNLVVKKYQSRVRG